jgi:hypothetical protein
MRSRGQGQNLECVVGGGGGGGGGRTGVEGGCTGGGPVGSRRGGGRAKVNRWNCLTFTLFSSRDIVLP